MRVGALAVLLALVAAACSNGEQQPVESAPAGPTSSPPQPGGHPPGSTVATSGLVPVAPSTSEVGDRVTAPSTELIVVASIPDAVNINVATNGIDAPVVAWIASGEVAVARLDLEEQALGDTDRVNGDVEPLTHPIERAGLAVRPDGTIDLAFTSFVGSAASVYYTRFEDGAWRRPGLISGEPEPETNLVHIGVSKTGKVALAWLEDSTLSVAPLDSDGEPAEIELVDDLTCDCCNMAPTFVDGTLLVPYRNYELIDGDIVRDTWSVRALDDGGFAAPVRIADDHWLLNACPFSGPHAVVVGESLIVAFMDARQSKHPDQASTSIWIDVSRDAGRSFGADLEVAGKGINRWPVMAVGEDGVVHLVWEVVGTAGGLAYATSDDVGASFSTPILIVRNGDGPGSAASPSVAHHDGTLIVAWTDREGGKVGLIDLG